METIKSIYKLNPEFVKDTLHFHFFNTFNYYVHRMISFKKLGISPQLNIMLFMVDYATDYKIENGSYTFELKINSIGAISRIPFPLLFNTLIKVCHQSNDIYNMYERIYSSKIPILVRLAEQFRKCEIDFARLSEELYEFIKKKECDTDRTWQLKELSSGSWNYTLLALNNSVWERAFDIRYISEIFQTEKRKLDAIDESELYSDEYSNYLVGIDNLILDKLN